MLCLTLLLLLLLLERLLLPLKAERLTPAPLLLQSPPHKNSFGAGHRQNVRIKRAVTSHSGTDHCLRFNLRSHLQRLLLQDECVAQEHWAACSEEEGSRHSGRGGGESREQQER